MTRFLVVATNVWTRDRKAVVVEELVKKIKSLQKYEQEFLTPNGTNNLEYEEFTEIKEDEFGSFVKYEDVLKLFAVEKKSAKEEWEIAYFGKPEAKTTCEWVRSFDSHFNISCVNETGCRGYGEFKGKGKRWNFAFCPYCGLKIEEKTK